MRDLLLPVGMLLGVVALVYFLWLGPSASIVPHGDTHAFASAAVAAPPAVSKSKAATKGGRTVLHDVPDPPPAPGKRALNVPDVQQASIIVETPTPAPAVELPPLVAPPTPRPPVNTGAVTIGMTARRVVALLGSPDLKTGTMQKGELVETYVYNSGEGPLVHINISGGQVIGVR